MVRKKERVKISLEKSPFLYYVTNVGFVEPIKEEDQRLKVALR